MNTIINIGQSEIFDLKFGTAGKLCFRNFSSSEDGFLAIIQSEFIIIGTIGFELSTEDKKYVFNQETVEIGSQLSKPIVEIEDFNFHEANKEKQIPDEMIYKLLFCDNYADESASMQFDHMDWSPLYPLVNKSYLAVMTFSGRVIVLGQNKRTNVWEKEYDLLDLFHQYYKDILLDSDINESGAVKCKTVDEYIQLRRDLRVTSFSWSSLVRISQQKQYCMIALLTKSGIISVWRIITDQKESRCEPFYRFRLANRTNDPNDVPISIQFCDLAKDTFLITIFYFDERIESFPFEINFDDNGAFVVPTGAGIPVSSLSRYSQPTRHIWYGGKYHSLIVGYESELLFAQFDEVTKSFSPLRLELPSIESVTGIVVKHNVVYVTTRDGFLFGVKLDAANIELGLELNEILIDTSIDGELLDVFVSPNGVHLGLLSSRDVALVCLMPEKELLNVLMKENKPFGRKLDAVEELRRTYANSGGHMLHAMLQKLSRPSDNHWGTSSLHSIQLARYLCVFFGYQLNIQQHEFNATGDATTSASSRQLDVSRVRKLEAIIVCRNISYWLDAFADLSVDQVVLPTDCAFAMGLCVRLTLAAAGTINPDFADAIEAARAKAKSLLASQLDEAHAIAELTRYEEDARIIECPVCVGEGNISSSTATGEFNLFVNKCSRGHVVHRCCKSLELFADGSATRSCRICGALERWVDSTGLSSWRLEIRNANCPFCDGKFTKSIS